MTSTRSGFWLKSRDSRRLYRHQRVRSLMFWLRSRKLMRLFSQNICTRLTFSLRSSSVSWPQVLWNSSDEPEQLRYARFLKDSMPFRLLTLSVQILTDLMFIPSSTEISPSPSVSNLDKRYSLNMLSGILTRSRWLFKVVVEGMNSSLLSTVTPSIFWSAPMYRTASGHDLQRRYDSNLQFSTSSISSSLLLQSNNCSKLLFVMSRTLSWL